MPTACSRPPLAPPEYVALPVVYTAPSRATSHRPVPPGAGDEPVAATGARRRHADDRLVEVHRAGGAVEVRVAEAEDAAVGGDEPVAMTAARRRDAHDGLVEVHRAGGAVEVRVAEAED